MSEEILRNCVTGEVMTVLESTPEVFRICFSLQPRCSIPGSHFHPGKAQRITVVSGEMHLRVGGVHQVLRAGESATIPAGAHHFQWNPTDTEMVAIEEIRPAGRTHEMFRTLFGLANDGKTNSKGYPSPLMAAVLIAEFGESLKPAPFVLRALFSALAPVATALGYRGTLRKYRCVGAQQAIPGSSPSSPQVK